MGYKAIKMTARYSRLDSRVSDVGEIDLSRVGFGASGYELATNAMKAAGTAKLNSLQFVEYKQVAVGESS